MSFTEAESNKPWYTGVIGDPEVRSDGSSWQKVLGVDGIEYWCVTGHNKGDHSQPDELIYPIPDRRSDNASEKENGLLLSVGGYFRGGIPDVSYEGWRARRELKEPNLVVA